MRSTRAIADRTPSARPPAAPEPPEQRSLANDLRDAVAGEVRFSAGDRAMYSTDSSSYRSPASNPSLSPILRR